MASSAREAPAVTDKTLHVNGGTDWSLNLASSRFGASATYSGSASGRKTPPSSAYGTCATLYCHSNGDPVTGSSAPYMVYGPIAWGGGCTVCHDVHNIARPGCSGCHGLDNSSGGYLIGAGPKRGSLAHVNVSPSVSMATGAYAAPTCASVYCHSSGQAAAAPFHHPVKGKD